MVLIFFSRCHVFYPLSIFLAYLSLFCKQFSLFLFYQHFFIPSLRFLSLIAISHHFLAFHCLSLPFLFFSPMSILHFPLFSRFLPFLNSFLSFLLFPPLPSFYTLFLPFFLDRPHFFVSTYVTFPVSFFTFHVSQNVSRETSFYRFSVFGDQREAICFLAFRKSLSFFASLIFKIIVFSILFLILSVFSTFSCIFACFT